MTIAVTRLTSHSGEIPTKSFELDNGKLIKTNYPMIKYWDRNTMRFGSIHSFFTYMKNHVDNLPAILIRGKAVPGLPLSKLRRLGANFIDKGNNWLMIDVDSFSLPDLVDPYSKAAVQYFIKNHLPSEFSNVACVASFSSSAGIINPGTGKPLKDGLNVHLFFELSDPISNSKIKRWLNKYPLDLALYNSVQPHYVMSPIVREGIECKIVERHKLVEGAADTVQVPRSILEIPDNSPIVEHDQNWSDPVGGLPSAQHVMVCRFMQAFLSDEICCEQRYLHARAFASNAYRTSGDAEAFVRDGLNHNRPRGYIHTDQILEKLDFTRPISCRVIVENGYTCPHYKHLVGHCDFGHMITSPYSLAIHLNRAGTFS